MYMLLEADIDAYVETHGPWIHHGAFASQLDSILSLGLVPGGDGTSHFDDITASRPGCVYLGSERHVTEWVGRSANLRIDIRRLDPQLIVADEDHFCDHWKRNQGRLAEVCGQNASFRDWMRQRADELGISARHDPDGFAWGCASSALAPISIGQWALSVKHLLDSREATCDSLRRGSIAYTGLIAPELIELVREPMPAGFTKSA
jgi:hypothetical protein